MILKGSVPVHPTEDREKVKRCITNIFPDAAIDEGPDLVSFSSGSFDVLVEMISNQQIRDTAVMVIRRNTHDDKASFSLNKQAGFMKRINFADEGPLGTIDLLIEEGASDLVDILETDA